MQFKTQNILLFILTIFSLSFLYLTKNLDQPLKYKIIKCSPVINGPKFYGMYINDSALEVSVYKNCCTSINISYNDKTLFIREINDKVCRCMCQCDILVFNIKPEKIEFIDFTGKIHHVSFENGANTN